MAQGDIVNDQLDQAPDDEPRFSSFGLGGLAGLDMEFLAAWIEEIRDYVKFLNADDLESGAITEDDLGKLVGDFISDPKVQATGEGFRGGMSFVDALSEQNELAGEPPLDILDPDFELGDDFSGNVPEFAETDDPDALPTRWWEDMAGIRGSGRGGGGTAGRYIRNLEADYPGAIDPESDRFPLLFGNPGYNFLQDAGGDENLARMNALDIGGRQLREANQRTTQRSTHRGAAQPLAGARGPHSLTTYGPRQIGWPGQEDTPPATGRLGIAPAPQEQRMGPFRENPDPVAVANDPAPEQPATSYADDIANNNPVLPIV